MGQRISEIEEGWGKERTTKGGIRIDIETMEERVLLLLECI